MRTEEIDNRFRYLFEASVGIGGIVGSLLARSGWPAIGALTVFGMDRMSRRRGKPIDDRAKPLEKIDIKGKDTRASYGLIGPVVYECKFRNNKD